MEQGFRDTGAARTHLNAANAALGLVVEVTGGAPSLVHVAMATIT